MIVVQFFLYKTIWVNLTTIQNVVQENIAEKRKLEEDLQNLEVCFLCFCIYFFVLDCSES